MKVKAGSETNKLSFTRSLVKKPRSINNANPPDEIRRIGIEKKPISKPMPPVISNTAVNIPNCSSPKRLNSFFMLGE